MRAHEFLSENEVESSIRDKLMLLLTTLHANNVPNISIKQLRQSLEASGHYVTRAWIQGQVGELGIVKSVDDNEVILDVEDSEQEPKEPEAADDAKTVEKMAKKALSRRK